VEKGGTHPWTKGVHICGPSSPTPLSLTTTEKELTEKKLTERKKAFSPLGDKVEVKTENQNTKPPKPNMNLTEFELSKMSPVKQAEWHAQFKAYRKWKNEQVLANQKQEWQKLENNSAPAKEIQENVKQLVANAIANMNISQQPKLPRELESPTDELTLQKLQEREERKLVLKEQGKKC